jgi:putative FmdB family regulatory protein
MVVESKVKIPPRIRMSVTDGKNELVTSKQRRIGGVSADHWSPLACILLFLAENCDRSPLGNTVFMPTYEYSCEKCGKTFEAFQSMRDEPLKECPKELCRMETWGHGKVKRLVGAGAGFIFKGSGFYITDYRSNSYKEAAKKDAPATATTGGEKSSPAKKTGHSTATSAPAKKSPDAKPKKQAIQ